MAPSEPSSPSNSSSVYHNTPEKHDLNFKNKPHDADRGFHGSHK